MLEPDLGYYLRAIRARWVYVLIAGLVGALVGVVLAVMSAPSTRWTATQRLEASSPNVFLVWDELSEVAPPQRSATDEADFVRVVAEQIGEESGFSASGDDGSQTLQLVASGSERSEAERKLDAVMDEYIAARTRRDDDYLDQLDRALDLQGSALTDALTDVDPASIARVQAIEGARRVIADLRGSQTGGIVALGDPTVTESARRPNLQPIAAFTILGMSIGAAVAIWKKTSRRGIDSENDLSLFPAMVSLGTLQTMTADRLTGLERNGFEAGDSEPALVVTQSMVGTKADELRSRLEASGRAVEQRSCLELSDNPMRDAEGQVIIAVDHEHDTERTMLDLLNILDHGKNRPIFAVLC